MTDASDADYILGHDEAERRRLHDQASFMEPLLRRSLLSAGAAVATARARATALEVTNVQFVEGDVRRDVPDGPFDAAIGNGRSFGGYRFLPETVGSIASAIDRTGLERLGDLDVDRLERRLRETTITASARRPPGHGAAGSE